jgi:predicted aldo/keto reductase-like oxidoreductase
MNVSVPVSKAVTKTCDCGFDVSCYQLIHANHPLVSRGLRLPARKLAAGFASLDRKDPSVKSSHRERNRFTRRQFIQTSALAGAALLSPWPVAQSVAAAVPTTARTAVDQVALGQTGLKLSRLGFGTGSNSGHEQTALGKADFTKLIHYAYDQGITYFDCAQAYSTFEWMGDAIKGLPREKLFIQSKIPGQPGDVLAAIDHHRKVFNTDYVDSLLIHCMVKHQWTDDWKRIMDGFNEAKEKQWIRAKGVSCHSLPALRAASASDWTEVHLVRVNPQGKRMDGEAEETWNNADPTHEVAPVMAEIKTIHAKGRGVIGMKIIGNGQFVNAEDRERSIRFAMSCRDIDAVVIGFTSRAQVDEAIERMDRALKEV